MVGTAEQSLYFVSVPELSRLCWVAVSLQQDENEPRNKQIQTCRELVLLYSDILACPALDSFSEITLIMATSFFKKGIIQAYGQRHNLQVSGPRSVLPGLLQCCVSYSLTCRLAPFWNKAGAFLISGQDFLTENGRMSAVCMQFSTSEKQLCVSVEANTVRLSPTRLEDFDIPSMVLMNFRSHSDAVISGYALGGNPWCYVLPSMKRGQIITISRQLNKDSPFRSYTDLQRHWNSLYGYRLPDLSEEEVIYCSVYFKPVGERLFTYPLSCIRLQPIERCSRLHQQEALESFVCDITNTLHSVCGVPVRWTSKPRYHTATLTSSASTQVLSGKAVNLSTQSQTQSSRAVVLTQHPASSSTPHTKPSVGPQPPARPLTSLQPPGSQSCGDQMGRTGSTEGILNGLTGSSSSTLSQASSFSIISPTPPPPSSHHPVKRVGPKLVPIFHNQSLKPHVNITLLLANKHKKQQEQPSRGAEERHRVSLPSFRKNRPPSAASSPPAAPLAPPLSLSTASFSSSLSSSTSSAALPRPPVVPLFARRPKSSGVSLLSHAHPRPNPNPNPLSNLRPSPNPRSTPNQIPNPLSHPKPSPNPRSTPNQIPNPLSHPRPSLYPRPNPNPSPLSNPRPSPNHRPNPSPNSDPRSRANPTLTISNPRPSFNPRPTANPSPISDPRPRPNFAPKSGSRPSPNHRPNPSPNSDPRSRANPTSTISNPRPSFNPRPTANPSPISDPRPRPNFAPKSGSSPIPNSISRQGAALVSWAEPRQDGGPQNAPPRALVPSDIPSNRGGDVFESKPKRPRPAVQDLDVEIMARNNQLSKVNAATLLAWLRGRGMSVRARDKKEQLMLRVMSCLAEA